MTWTGQSFSVGQILTAAQMNNLQADITALANGDSGAPGVKDKARDDTVASGTSVPIGAAIPAHTDYTTFVKVAEMVVLRAGTIYSTFTLETFGGSTGYCRLYKNDSPIGTTHSTTSATPVTKSDSGIAVAKGDRLQLYARHAIGTSYVRPKEWYLKGTTGSGVGAAQCSLVSLI